MTDGPVLIVTCVEDITTDLVVSVLNERRVPVVRADPADIGSGLDFAARIGSGSVRWEGGMTTETRTLDLSHVRSVYWRRPGPWRYGALPQQPRDFATAEARHGLVGLLAALPVRYISHPVATARAEYKPVQLAAAVALGLSVPTTLITNDLAEARRFAYDHAPVVYKTFRGVPASEDGRRGVIWTQRIDGAELDQSVSMCPHMFQEELAKSADVRITIVGDRVFASRVETPEGLLDWRAGDWETFRYERCSVPRAVVEALFAYLAVFDLAFGCFDFVIDMDGRWWWLECNPNGQWAFLPEAEAIAAAFADLLQVA